MDLDRLECKIKLYDYLLAKCPYEGCKNNSEGLCLSNNIDYLDYISKIIKTSLNINTGALKNQNIICDQAEFNYGHCKYCNSKLIETHTRHLFGESYAMEVLYECPRC